MTMKQLHKEVRRKYSSRDEPVNLKGDAGPDFPPLKGGRESGISGTSKNAVQPDETYYVAFIKMAFKRAVWAIVYDLNAKFALDKLNFVLYACVQKQAYKT